LELEISVRLNKLGAALVVVFSMVVAAPKSASAATIVLTEVDGNVYQNSVQNPCIFSNPPCYIDGFSVKLPNQGTVTGYDATATYLGSDLLDLMNGSTLMLGLDIDTNIRKSRRCRCSQCQSMELSLTPLRVRRTMCPRPMRVPVGPITH
jgi:hypothetical protein